MNQKKKQNPFWHLAGPLLGYWVIQLVAEIIVSMLVMLPYAAKYLSLVMNHASEMNYTDVVNKYYGDDAAGAGAGVEICYRD